MKCSMPDCTEPATETDVDGQNSDLCECCAELAALSDAANQSRAPALDAQFGRRRICPKCREPFRSKDEYRECVGCRKRG
jgi:hypothetical protein